MPKKISKFERDAVIASSTLVGATTGGAAGAKLGAMIGSCGCPGVGTVAGAALGGGIGTIAGFASGRFLADQMEENDQRKGRY